MPTTDRRRRRRRRRPEGPHTTRLILVLVALGIALALVVTIGRSIADRTSGLLTSPGCRVTGSDGATVSLDPEQAANAATISAVSIRRRLPARAPVIAVATAMQESKLRNLDHGDRDSLGLFQQRPSQGWGTAADVQNPSYASERFYDHLVKVDRWQTRPLTEVAQDVQRSGFPEAYADHEADATVVADAFTGGRTGAVVCRLDPATSSTTAARVAAAVDRDFGVRSSAQGRVVTVGTDTTRGAAAVAAWAVAHADDLGVRSVSVAGRTWTRARDDSSMAWPSDRNPTSTARKVVVTLAG